MAKIAAPQTKVARHELMAKVQEVIESHTDDPIAQLRTLGEALVKIADTLEAGKGAGDTGG